MSVVDIYSAEVKADLAGSGVEPGQMRVRPLGPNERYATNTPAQVEGFVIPYFDMRGRPLPFYRVKLYNVEPKYKQLINQPNHIYYPPGFFELVTDPKCPYIMLTEGEKKAACAVSRGIACVGVGGVDSWRNRTIFIPKGSNLVQGNRNSVVAKLPSGTEAVERLDSLAVGMQDLIELCIHRKIPLIICYDGDEKGRIKQDVQSAAAALGFELRFRGMKAVQVKQLILKPNPSFTGDKIGLDDFLTHPKMGMEAFETQMGALLAKRAAFPRHPNPKAFINKRLQRTRMPRNELHALSMSVLCDLDSNGARLRCPDDDRLYYFHTPSHELIPVGFNLHRGFANTAFGVHLYRAYNLGGGDHRLMECLETMFTGEEPITSVDPERVLTVRKDDIYYQMSGGRMLRINRHGVTVLDNGTEDILFEAGTVEDLDESVLTQKIDALMKQPTIQPYWYETLKESRVTADNENDYERKALALLYSISPWFYRWRGTQLPIEMMIAEPGAGKSTMFTLRLDILTGQPRLRNAPRDLRDWTASVASTGGLHVTDNVNLSNSQLRQELSDEICRVITEPNPTIEARKLYTDNELIQVPVKTVFALTAVRQPFNNPDILQRAIITYLDKGDDKVTYEADWEARQLRRFGGREGWVAYHAVVAHRVLKLVHEKWDPSFQAKFRLINVEQLLGLVAEVYGWESDWIAEHLESVRDKSVATSDWALEGLVAYANEQRGQGVNNNKRAYFSAAQVTDWVMMEEDFNKCQILIAPRQLGKYIAQHKNLVSRIAGISPLPETVGNRVVYYIHDPLAPSAQN